MAKITVFTVATVLVVSAMESYAMIARTLNKLKKLTGFSRLQSVLLVLIILTAVVTRFYQLGNIPDGLTWDEAAIGYNGYALLTTRRDEWLEKLPVSFRSFGDYKAPLAIYANGVFTAVFGMNEFGVRFPFALAGIIFIASFGWLSYELFYHSSHRSILTLSALVLATLSPWHWHYSRIGFEAGLALALIIFGVAAAAYLRRTVAGRLNTWQIVLAAAAILAMVLSLYAYHSAKVFVPVLAVAAVVWLWKIVKTNKVVVISLVVGAVVLLVPLLRDSLYGDGATRASVLITSQGLPITQLALVVSQNVFAHLTPEFLLLGETESLRHGTGYLGVLSITTWVLFWAAIIQLLASLLPVAKKYQITGSAKAPYIWLGIVMVVAGLLPAALSAQHIPHSNRALLALPGFLLLALTSLHFLLSKFQQTQTKRILIGLFLLVELLQALAFWQHYTTVFAQESADDFQAGYVEAMELAVDYERGEDGKPQVDKILVTSEYGQPYIFVLFARETSPIAYRGGSLYKYEFHESMDQSLLERDNVLVIATPQDTLPKEQADHIIKSGDEIRFLMYYTGE